MEDNWVVWLLILVWNKKLSTLFNKQEEIWRNLLVWYMTNKQAWERDLIRKFGTRENGNAGDVPAERKTATNLQTLIFLCPLNSV